MLLTNYQNSAFVGLLYILVLAILPLLIYQNHICEYRLNRMKLGLLLKYK
jgi:hypothetical protein